MQPATQKVESGYAALQRSLTPDEQQAAETTELGLNDLVGSITYRS